MNRFVAVIVLGLATACSGSESAGSPGGAGGAGGSGGTGGVGGTGGEGCTAPCLELTEWLHLPELGTAHELVVVDGRAFVAGHGGVARVDLATGAHALLPLPDDVEEIQAIAFAPGRPSVLFAGEAPDDQGHRGRLFVTENRGDSWRAVVYPSESVGALQRRSLVVAPGPENGGAGILFVNTGCNGLAVTADLGATFRTLAPASDLCVQTPLGLSHSGRTLWLGTELGLDIVAIWRRDVSLRGDTPAGPWTLVVEGQELLANHDPNTIVADPEDPEGVYVGAELSLMHVSGDDRFEYRFGSAQFDDVPYVLAIWIDPENPDHVVFGGGDNGGRARLLESFEGGRDARDLVLPGMAGEYGMIEGIVSHPDGEHLLVLRSEHEAGTPWTEARTTLLRARVVR